MRILALAISIGLALPVPESVAQHQDQGTTSRPIQALLVTGGCCHDYERQKRILTRGISARANVQWTVVQQGGKTTDTAIELYRDPDWADGFDIIVHNECFAGVDDPQFVDRILAPHRDGTPAILIHCAMHCYRVGDDRWFRFVGIESPGHGPHYSFAAKNLRPDHPIMSRFGDSFVVPQGELYHSAKVLESATPLAQADRQSDGQPQACVWTNDYHGTRVFGTTIGHYNETIVQPKYLDTLAKGLLWAVGRDPQKDFSPTDDDTDKKIEALSSAPASNVASKYLPQNCCGDGNVAYKKPVTAKSTQDGNATQHLTDGLLDTRWCANGSQVNEWVTVDLQEPQSLGAIRLHWEKPRDIVYRYTVEASTDNESWQSIVDASENEKPGGILEHEVDVKEARYLRITFLGASRGVWGSIWELEASAGELPLLSEIDADPTPTASFVDVQSPPGFNVTPFGVPPEINYPVCLTAAATGEVFVGVDEQGSLGKESGRGKVLRCVDTDGDGMADRVNVFAKIDHPRGLVYDDGSLWVLHPPTFSVYRDTDRDGIADQSEVLIDGISTTEVERRGADHTTNGIRMGIDGWIYIAVGDYGFHRAVAKDGTVLSRRGGGIVRIRPDGTDMEIYTWGLRNVLDVAIDPYMNIFTRGNTNDGGGWDIRLLHIFQSANYGYPSLYKNFSDEIMPPLADYGGGSGCGAMFLDDGRWPEPFDDLLLTCDWGRSVVFSHDLPKNGPTYDAQQETFLKLPRPTDIDVDASGRMYVSSWKNGKFAYDGPNVGFVAQITPAGFVPHPVPDVKQLADEVLVDELASESASWRLTIQREVLRRGETDRGAWIDRLQRLAGNDEIDLDCRVAALFTIGQFPGLEAAGSLTKLMDTDSLRPYAIRAISESDLPSPLNTRVIAALRDPNPRCVTAALIALGRMYGAVQEGAVQEGAGQEGMPKESLAVVANAILPLTRVDDGAPRTNKGAKTDGDDWRQPHPERVIPHLAIQALANIRAIDPCLEAIDGPYRPGAMGALKLMHDARVVSGLFRLLSSTRDAETRHDIWTTLIRLYHREGAFTQQSRGWWGTRPDTTGPYYDRQTWEQSDRIGRAIGVALAEAAPTEKSHIESQLQRHVVKLGGRDAVDTLAAKEPEKAITIPKVDPDDPNQIANLEYDAVLSRVMPVTGDPDAGKQLFAAQSCIHCHTYQDGQQPKGPHLVDISKRYKKDELIESTVAPSKKIAQGFDTWAFLMDDGNIHTGFVVSESAETVIVRGNNGISRELLQDNIERRVKRETSMMPDGIVDNLTPEQLADLIAYLQSLR